MRIVVVGGSGHIGTYLVPRLVRAGHEVISISRGDRRPYAASPEWDEVRLLAVDRTQQDQDGTFARTIRDLRVDAVIDLLCFTTDSARALVDGLRGHVGHLVHCGSLWRYGPSIDAPIREGRGTPPLGDYGIQKDAIARLLKDETAGGGLVTTSVDPGQIVGPGWEPVGPLGNRDPRVWHILSAGETLRIPGSGADFLHHVHADDVAQVFELAVEKRDLAAGEDFHAVAATALNSRGLAQIAAGWFDQEAHLEFIDWELFRAETTPEFAQTSWEHLHRNHVLSIEKSSALLGYAPRHRPEDAVLAGVRSLIDSGILSVARPLVV